MSAPAYFHNDQPITRDAFYAIACDPRRSVAVEACAGAGKTWMLVSRILRALIEPAPGSADGAPLAPHEILAITFTRKAAGSQFERVSVILPPPGSPLPTRELLYTAVTRAESGVRLYGSPDALRKAVGTRARRASGLVRTTGPRDTKR